MSDRAVSNDIEESREPTKPLIDKFSLVVKKEEKFFVLTYTLDVGTGIVPTVAVLPADGRSDAVERDDCARRNEKQPSACRSPGGEPRGGTRREERRPRTSRCRPAAHQAVFV